MKFVRFDSGQGARTGVLSDGRVVDVHVAVPSMADLAKPGDMTALLQAGAGVLDQIRAALAYAPSVAESDVKLLAPITNPPKMLAAWVNNVPEGEKPPYKQPIFFAKYATSIIGPGDNIVLPACTKNVVVEPELTVIIGKGGRYIKEEDALSHVAGYTIVNDVTSFNHRLVDLMDSRGPNMMAKIFDTFAPTGPYIVTSDEVGDPGNLQVRQWLNDELKTDNNTRNYLIGVPAFISYLSSFLTLEVGDMILMGSFRPLAELTFLSPGDQVRIEIEKVGVQENPVVAEG